jgi:leucyl-tRNA synthetase
MSEPTAPSTSPEQEAARFDPRAIEPAWQKRWQDAGVFVAKRTPGKKKYFVMEMFPYPSGRLHMGHVRNYTMGDVVARVRRMQGHAVLYPMGWDAFGLPAENAAIKAKVHPRSWTLSNIQHMRDQFVALGLSYDWSRELTSCEPDYFVHEQRIFIEMWRKGLAYRKGALVNWCDTCGTVLANEQVEDGVCWRCSNPVRMRELEQWFLKITEYADQLLADVAKLEGRWPDKVLRMQENWIGRSVGARIAFALEQPVGGVSTIEVFTTRPDTLYGVTFMSIAPEHPLALKLAAGSPQEGAVREFVERVRKEDKIKRGAEDYEKAGVDTGARVVHPLTGKSVPVFVANFVLMDYGTGAVMAVPAHDQRDFDFATKYGLPKIVVIQKPGDALDAKTMKAAYTEAGVMTASGPFDGTPNEEGKAKVAALLAEKSVGGPTVSYRIRDWLLSRQRYWGCPIPMVRCATHGYLPVPEQELPITLPDDVTLAEGGKSPLATHPTWKIAKCPTCGGPAERETDTMDGFMESSWYPLRYASPRTTAWMDRDELDYWMPVDQYIGGAEHATKHLIYARFFTKMLRDWGWVGGALDEPFTRLLTQGMVCKETYRCPQHDYLYPEELVKQGDAFTCKHCGKPVTVGRIEKMSKTLRNVVEPMPLIEKFGADTVRLFSLFAAPADSMLEWSEAGVEGAFRFLQRLWRLAVALAEHPPGPAHAADEELRQKTHATLKKVTDDIGGERFQFNTAIAAIMELTNAVYAHPTYKTAPSPAVREAVEAAVRVLHPMAPHLTEEAWVRLGHGDLLASSSWPAFDANVAQKKRTTYAVQVMGKLRGQVEGDVEADQASIEALARALDSARTYLEGKETVKVVFVKGRLINFVVK